MLWLVRMHCTSVAVKVARTLHISHTCYIFTFFFWHLLPVNIRKLHEESTNVRIIANVVCMGHFTA
jgi:hypothetical protein